jgi:pimeloyl-ACP methyl ester carboxylesterase
LRPNSVWPFFPRCIDNAHHGIGPLLSKLSSDHSYDFVDGEIPCAPAHGIELLYPPPFLCYYDRHETASIHSALTVLGEIIEEDGPFDGIIGFSQGAALAASFILSHQLDSPQKALPFKVAIFIAGGLPLSPSPTKGKDITAEARLAEKTGGLMLSPLQEKELEIVVEMTNNRTIVESPDDRIFSFDPDFFSGARISIPTVHIIGSNDPWAGYSKALVRLCRADLTKVQFHNGGHDVPRSESSLRLCADRIEEAIGVAHLSRW